MPLGHPASLAPMLVQRPKHTLSVCAIMFVARIFASGRPCGSNARWETLAERNSMAEALGQAATQAPQPMQAAAAKLSSAFCFSIGSELASCALPVFTEI